MNNGPRITIGAFAYLFAVNHLALGLAWISYFGDATLAWIPYVIYFAAVNLLVLTTSQRKISTWLAALGAALAFSVNTLSLSLLDAHEIPSGGSYATWFVGGVSTLYAMIAVRGHRLLAIMGLVAQVIQSLVWGGFETATTMGLVGAIMLVGAAVALSTGFEAMGLSARRFEERAQSAAAQAAASAAGREAREAMLESALDRALPTLKKLVREEGKLSEEAREDTEQLVLDLRDELNGRNLLNPAVRMAIKEARARGVTVRINDDGGLDDYPAVDLPALHAAIARAIDEVIEGVVTIRSPKNENYRVAITGQGPNSAGPDVWRRLT